MNRRLLSDRYTDFVELGFTVTFRASKFCQNSSGVSRSVFGIKARSPACTLVSRLLSAPSDVLPVTLMAYHVYFKGTSLRELLHKFRHRTLTIVKLLMLQKRVSQVRWSAPYERLSNVASQIMLYGYPVERLCTYQYSLISLMPGKSLG
jgi:hypothetical protein